VEEFYFLDDAFIMYQTNWDGHVTPENFYNWISNGNRRAWVCSD